MGRQGIVFGICMSAFVTLPAHAVNPVFQEFFFGVCANPTGALAERCSETPSSAGDLSGDSESSLNPSQTLSATDGALAEARSRSKEARERVERYRDDDEIDLSRVSLGPLSLLLHGRFEWEERDRRVDVDAERGFEAERRAIEIGLDRRFSDSFVAGLIYAFEDGDLDFDAEAPGIAFTPASDAGSVAREAHAVTVFGVLWLTEQAYLEANAGYAASDYVLTRNAVFQETTRNVPQTNVRTRATTDGDQLWLGLTAGYGWSPGASSYGVYAGAAYSESSIDGYREREATGSGLALVVDGVERQAFTAHLGFRAQRAISTTRGVWMPQLRIEYEHAGGVDESEAAVRFALDGNGNRFELSGDDGEDGYFNVAVGVAAVFPNGWTSFADVESLAGAGDREQYRFTVGIRKEL